MSRPSELSNAYYQHLLRIVGITASTVPFLVVGLGLLVKAGVLNDRYYVNDFVFMAISFGFAICALANYYFVFVSKDPSFRVYLGLSIAFHTLAVLFLLFVSGLFSPFILCWVLIAVAVDLYFGMTSMLVSMAVLCLTCLVAFYLYPDMQAREQLSIFACVLLIVVTTLTLSRLRNVNDEERVALAQTRDLANIQRERLLALVNSMGDAVVTTDERGVIKIYNAATLSLLDTNKDLLDKNIDYILNVKDAKGTKVNILAEAIKKRRVFSREDLVHSFTDADPINLYINVAPVQPGYHTRGERGYIFIMRDITKDKTLEEERDEFISVVSHELRTPIAIAEGTISNLMLLADRGATKAMMARSVKNAHDQILFLAKLVNDLSTLSRAERGLDNNVEVVNINALLQNTYKEYSAQATAKQLKLNLDLPTNIPHMRTSKLYLEEMLQNFITNAIKYTPEGSITLAAKLNDGLRISVTDTGIGMSQHDQKRIFEKFYRSEDYRTRETNGTGLGLYVCKKLAQKLHVAIEFESRLNHGSTFTIAIPKDQLTTDAVLPKVDLPAGYVPTK